MTYTFNLIDSPWIPCICRDGLLKDFGLGNVFSNAHVLRGIQGDSPLETAAIYRLLLAVMHSALRGPEDLDDWSKFLKDSDLMIKEITNYLANMYDHFDLFHPKFPFYQQTGLHANPKSVNLLVMDWSSGHNAVLFSHHTDNDGANLSPAKAARSLIVTHTFSLAGLSGLEEKHSDSPWARGVIFLAEGKNLLTTLLLNLFNYPDDTIFPCGPLDQPAWEMSAPYQGNRQIPNGYLDFLTWQSRRILLIPEDSVTGPVVKYIKMAPGLHLDAMVLDPMKLYRKGKKDGYQPLRYMEDRALWRDSASFFALKITSEVRPPYAFRQMTDLADENFISDQSVFQFMGLGMANYQAKVIAFHEDHLPLPINYFEQNVFVENLASGLILSDQIGSAVKIACQWLALLILAPTCEGKKWIEVDKNSQKRADELALHWNAERHYWQKIEIPFIEFMNDLPKDPEAAKSWKNCLLSSAGDALEHAINFAGDSSMALKASVRARKILAEYLGKM